MNWYLHLYETYDHQIYKMVTYLDGFVPIKLHCPLITWFCKITWQIKIFTTTVSMSTKLGRMLTYLDGLLPIKSRDLLITCFCEITWQSKIIIISTTTVSMATKRGRLVSYHDGFLPMLLHPLFTWSYEITWETRTTVSPPPLHLWPQNLTRWWLTLTAFYP